ncbi:hypothetical protein CVG87_24050 [Pseudomonas sp. WCS365]|nr:hypothetical protein CVG87_24050 [Pseudomonas sp. WCS365]
MRAIAAKCETNRGVQRGLKPGKRRHAPTNRARVHAKGAGFCIQRKVAARRYVEAKLARETGASVSERPHRLHRGQALLPQLASLAT